MDGDAYGADRQGRGPLVVWEQPEPKKAWVGQDVHADVAVGVDVLVDRDVALSTQGKLFG